MYLINSDMASRLRQTANDAYNTSILGENTNPSITSNLLSGVGGLASAGLTAYQTYADVNSPSYFIQRANNYQLPGTAGLGSFDDWTQAYLNNSKLKRLNWKTDVGYNSGKATRNTLGAAAGGAAAGASIGSIISPGLGTLAGGLIGGVLGGIGGLFSNSAAKRKAQRTAQLGNDALAQVENYNDRLLNNNLSTLKMNQFGSLNRNYIAAYGGPLGMIEGPIDYSMAMQYLDMKNNAIQNKLMADGGQLHSHGSDWNTGLNYVGNGGSHEENPYDGVPMGIAPDGQPNLVEEGEVIWNNDYVFSKRLKVPKAVRNKYKLRGTKPISFADAVMQVNKEAEERPNDPITLRGRDAVLGALAEVQEVQRAKKEAKEQQEDMLLQQKLPMIAANGGHLFWGGSSMMRPGNIGFITPYYDETPMSTPQPVLDFNDPNYRRNVITDYVKGLSSEDYNNLINTIGGKALNYKDNPQGLVDFAYSNKNNRERTPKTDPVYYGILDSYRNKNVSTGTGIVPGGQLALSDLATPPITSDIKFGRRNWNFTFPRVADSKDYYPKEAILRYAPVVGSTISVLNDIFGGANKPTGERGAAIRNAVRGLRDVSFDPVGGYMAPNPIDLDYMLNALSSGAGANRNALLNTAGGNRGTAMAGILASDNQYLNAIGNARLATEKENFERELKRKEFNAKLDEFNKTGMLQAAIRNQGKDEVVAKYLALAADADAQEKLLSNSTISADFTNLFDNLGAVGTDAINRADTRWLAQNWPGANAPSSYGKQKVVGYQMGLDGQYIPIYGKNGGKLNKKRRK